MVFLDGMCQGAKLTLHIMLLRGENTHHIWEAIFRAIGQAMNMALSYDEKREGFTAGVAGNIEYK